jgi:hypothetical protein
MTRGEFIKQIEELDKILLEEVDLELTDYAREQAHYGLEDVINKIKENEE